MERRFTVQLVIALVFLVVSGVVVAFLVMRGGSGFLSKFGQEDRCSAENMAAEAEIIAAQVHHFEDVKFVAILTSREQLVTPILKLQDIRYEAEALEMPDCLVALEKTAINYMNSVIVYMSHHMAGFDSEQVRTEFQYSEELLAAYRAEYARVTGKTFESPAGEVTPAP